MPKWLRAAVVVIMSVLLSNALAFAEDDNFWQALKEKGPVKVFLKNFVNESGNDRIKAEDFRAILERSLINRRSLTFKIVKTPEESDIQISANIKDYRYLDKGPMNMSPSMGGIILEAAATAAHNYADMKVVFMVIDTKTNTILWNDTINAFVKKSMTAEESIPRIYDRVSRDFLWKCFGKPR